MAAPPDTGIQNIEKDENSIYTAVTLAIIASVIWATGNCIQKKAHNDLNQLNQKQGSEKHLYQSKTWIIGLVIYLIGSIIGGKALTYGSLSVVGTLESTTLIWNAMFAAQFLNEKIRLKDIQGMLIIIFGCVMVVLCGPKDDLNTDGWSIQKLISYFQERYFEQSYWIFELILTVLALICCVILNYFIHLKTNVQSMQTEKRVVTGTTVVLISFIYLSTYSSCWNMVIQKSFFLLMDHYKDVTLYQEWFFWYCVFAFAVANTGLEYFKQQAMKYYKVATIIPIFRVGGVLCACAIGATYFGEFWDIERSDKKLGFFIALILILVGIGLLTSKKDTTLCESCVLYDNARRETVTSLTCTVVHVNELP